MPSTHSTVLQSGRVASRTTSDVQVGAWLRESPPGVLLAVATAQIIRSPPAPVSGPLGPEFVLRIQRRARRAAATDQDGHRQAQEEQSAPRHRRHHANQVTAHTSNLTVWVNRCQCVVTRVAASNPPLRLVAETADRRIVKTHRERDPLRHRAVIPIGDEGYFARSWMHARYACR